MKGNTENDRFFLDLVIDGLIVVSEEGIVVNNRTGKEIGFITGGYKRINMFGKTCGVNRLVYMVYVDDSIPEGMIVNHEDGNKLHNHFSNLNLKTEGENIEHAYQIGLQKVNIEHLKSISKGSLNGMAKFTNDEVLTYRKAYDNFDINISDIMSQTGLLRKAVQQMLNAISYTDVKYRISRSTRKHNS